MRGKIILGCLAGRTWRNSNSNLWRRKLLRDRPVQQGGQQRVAQDLTQVLGHDGLLLHTAVVLKRQDDGEV